MCFKILEEISTILECMTSFDKGTATIFFFWSNPQTSSTRSRAQGFTKVSPIVCGFFCLAYGKQPCKRLQDNNPNFGKVPDFSNLAFFARRYLHYHSRIQDVSM